MSVLAPVNGVNGLNGLNGAASHTGGSSWRGGHDQARTRLTEPLAYTGSLDGYVYRDVTPAIGREFEGLQVRDVLADAHRDDLIRDLAVTGTSYGRDCSQLTTSLATRSRLSARPVCQSSGDARALREHHGAGGMRRSTAPA